MRSGGARKAVRFGIFELDLETGELKKNDFRLKIQDQPLRVLMALLEHPGEVVTREQLQRRLWPDDVFVSFEQNLNRAVNKLREVLGDSAENPRFIQTLPRRGYRFIAPVTELNSPAASVTSSATSPSSEPSSVVASPLPGPFSSARHQSPGITKPIWIAAFVAFAALLVLARLTGVGKGIETRPASAISVAVLRFNPEGSSTESDAMGLAVADQIADYLSSVRSLSVRPLSSSAHYSESELQAAESHLKSSYLLAGHYYVKGSRLQVHLEAIDTGTQRVVWSDDVSGDTENMLQTRDRIAERLRNGFLPSLAAPLSETGIARTSNGEAYDLYLRTLALSHEGEPNAEAIGMLERAVALDPSFAPAWEKLGRRLQYKYVYARGGRFAYEQAQHAYEQAFLLDPNLVSAEADLIEMQVENGDLNLALPQAEHLVQAEPESARAHFALSYVLRYGGALRDSARQCEVARQIDPTDYTLRTCAQTFLRLGDYRRAMDYIQLDSGSDWAQGMMLQVLIRTGDTAEALKSIRPLDSMSAPLVRACIAGEAQEKLLELSRAEENFPVADPEARYHVAAVDAFCKLDERATRLLVAAANSNYCPAEDLDRDPLLTRLAASPAFVEVKHAAQQCRSRFPYPGS